jgi:hypothetical protein
MALLANSEIEEGFDGGEGNKAYKHLIFFVKSQADRLFSFSFPKCRSIPPRKR